MSQHFTSIMCERKIVTVNSNQKKYWVEFQLLDELDNPVANMPYRAVNDATRCNHIKEYTGQSDASGVIRIEGLHPLELTLLIDAQPLADEMEKRTLRVSREPESSKVREVAEKEGYIWHYAVIGELCDQQPEIANWEPETPPEFHFPKEKAFKGFSVPKVQLDKRHVIEICPFRAWSLVLHHQKEYSIANAINLGAAAALVYNDDDINKKESITSFFLKQCQDLSRLPELLKDGYKTNTLTVDVPFSLRYEKPIFLDTRKAKVPDGDTQLFYVYNTEQLIVSWRGTASLMDGVTDMTYRPITSESCDEKMQCSQLVPKGKVHKGFWDGYGLINEKFKSSFDKITRLAEEKELYVCGHSLGGALALIHSAQLKDAEPLLYTYGMPRTFTRDAVELLIGVTHYRHVNDTDIVPSVPPEANLDNWLYKLYGHLGTVMGGLWSTAQIAAYQVYEWGDCYWHHGHPVVFFEATETEQWKECKTTLPYPKNCMTIRKKLPYTAKLYLVPELANDLAQQAKQQQEAFVKGLTKEDLAEIFPQGTNPERDNITSIFKHFMTAYMPYINNKLLELTEQTGLSQGRQFSEHTDIRERFEKQMAKNKNAIPEKEFQRNTTFLSLEKLLPQALSATQSLKGGIEALERFAVYGEEEVEL